MIVSRLWSRSLEGTADTGVTSGHNIYPLSIVEIGTVYKYYDNKVPFHKALTWQVISEMSYSQTRWPSSIVIRLNLLDEIPPLFHVHETCYAPIRYTSGDRVIYPFVVYLTSLFHYVPRPGGSVVSVSDSWPSGCEFETLLRRNIIPAFFRLSHLLKYVRKVVGGFGKKFVLELVWESHVRNRPPSYDLRCKSSVKQRYNHPILH